jgi:hypothetical protein
MLDNPPYLDVRIVDRQVRQEAADRLKNYTPHYDDLNLYWNHGVQQAIKLLESDAMEEKKRQKLLSRFREFNDTMDRSRKTKWYETFPNIASKVLVE